MEINNFKYGFSGYCFKGKLKYFSSRILRDVQLFKYSNVFFILLFLSFSCISFAQIPRTISYQGVLTDNSGNPKSDGSYSFVFYLYETSTGGNPIWSESKTLNVSKGLFSTSLGNQTIFADSIKFNKPYWLGIKVGNETELSPRISMASSGYSFSSINSDTAQNIADGKVVKSLNGLKDNVTLEGAGGTTITSSKNKIIISSSGSGGTGIQGVQNTNNTLDITNSNGPTSTLNLKVPLTLSQAESNSATLSSFHTGTGGVGIKGESPSGTGISGKSTSGSGIYGETSTWFGVYGKATGENGKGVYGESATSWGVWGNSPSGTGVVGLSDSWIGVYGESKKQTGVWGSGITGVYGEGQGTDSYGVKGSSSNIGVWGQGVLLGVYATGLNAAVKGVGTYVGIWGESTNGQANNYAGWFVGNVHVTGTLSKSAGSFKIDHPLDPANKYLSHSFVESPDMKNIYDGVVTTNENGNAIVNLPDWFEALNRDFRYQLTVVGQFAQAIIESEIRDNQFAIKTDRPNVKVSWQVTGIRHDVYAEENRIQVEELKLENERGKYIYPEGYGLPSDMRISPDATDIKLKANSNENK